MRKLLWYMNCFLLCMAGVFQPIDSFAQEAVVYRVVMTNGNTYIGTIVSEDNDQVVLHTEELGEVTIKRENIKTMEEVDPNRIKEGEFWFENPHATRYLFSTNAIGLKPKEGYYQNTWVFFNNINYGLSNNISLGAGMVPTFLFGASSMPIWFMPKVSIPVAKKNLHFAAGGLFGGIVGEESVGLGLAYGIATLGNTDNNVSLGIGYGYGDGEWGDSPFFNLSGMYRMTRKTYFISENYFFSFGEFSTGLISAAIRWAPENFAVDFGLFRPTVDADMIGFPWLGVTLPFGR